MGKGQYNRQALQALWGYSRGVYNDTDATKMDGSSFKALPNTASVYSETYLWSPPGGAAKKEIACLSVPAPALDSSKQPHYQYYMKEDRLDERKYDQEMQFLFKTIEHAVRDNKETAFNGAGIKRLVLSRFGQVAFLGKLSQGDRAKANAAYRRQLEQFLTNIEDVGLEVVMSEYSQPTEAWHQPTIVGDIIDTSEPRDLIINAWDPHSAPGNGNDADRSLDGAMGKSTGIIGTQTSWLNKALRRREALVAIL